MVCKASWEAGWWRVMAVPLPGGSAGGSQTSLEPRALQLASLCPAGIWSSTVLTAAPSIAASPIDQTARGGRQPSCLPAFLPFPAEAAVGILSLGILCQLSHSPSYCREGQPCASSPLARLRELSIKCCILHIAHSGQSLWGYLLPNGRGLATRFKIG